MSLDDTPSSDSGGQECLHPDRGSYRGLVEQLRVDGYWVCTDLCGVDYLGHTAPRNLPCPGDRVECSHLAFVGDILSGAETIIVLGAAVGPGGVVEELFSAYEAENLTRSRSLQRGLLQCRTAGALL